MPISPRLRRPRAALASLTAFVASGIVVLVVSGCVGLGGGTIDTVGEVRFDRPLRIPPLAASTVDAEGRRHFSLTAQDGATVFHEQAPTPTRGFDGSHLGPTLVANEGERVVVDVRNDLDDPTTVHWHGMELPAEMDGGPHQMIASGGDWTPEWTIGQPAATLWYHPHPHGATELHVRQGLAGMFLVRDEAERALRLPSEYGVDDVPVMVQDVRFDGEGRFATDVRGSIGLIGDELLVNGTLGPYLEVTTELVRLRLLNASTARVYDFGLDDGRDLQLIATDGGLLEAPVATRAIRLSPGERAEVVVSMRPGETAVLRSTPPDLGMSAAAAGMNAGNDRFDVLELRAAAELSPSVPIPDTLVPMERISDVDAVERRFALDGTNINGRQMDASRIDEVVETGRTEAWTVVNEVGVPHNFHVHGARFEIASIDGERPPQELAGWKDTVYLPPDAEYRLVMRFDHADPDRPYMYHCHLLWHEDRGMMGQFVVVRPGQEPGEPPPAHGGAPSESVTSFGIGSSHDHH